MKLMRLGPLDQERPHVLASDGRVFDVSDQVHDFDSQFFAEDRLEELRQLLDKRDPERGRSLEGTRIGPPTRRPGKIVCIGLNYADHARESGAPVPPEPVVFFKAPNTVVGPHDDLLIPVRGEKTDWEVELGVVIGRTARYISDVTQAQDYVAGYVLSHDVSERAFQLERGGQWVKGKSCESFNPLGPWIATRDEIADPQNLRMWLTVNGHRMQGSSTAEMLFSVYHVVWYLSQFMVLEPGDLINTGTPAGVGLGMDPPVFLREGDVVELGIEGLGTQRQTCRQAIRQSTSYRRSPKSAQTREGMPRFSRHSND